ncbi:MAG: D-alanyl-D-alanine carboxypeptidase [Patescibacteria group bacterium]|nr:D-alanyl-D-alanine carboxypeptidase [Patescibacteria group bacterium]
MSHNKRILIILGAFFVLAVILVAGFKKITEKKKESGSQNPIPKILENKITDKERNDYFLKTNFIDENGSTPFNTLTDGAVVFDQETGQILYTKNPDFKGPTASISKIMTAVIVLENANLNKEITVSKNAASQIPNSMDLKEGEKLKAEDLMYGMMMLSANDASFALAEGTLGYDNFVKAMNDKAKWLELKNTNFTNPAGLDDSNHKSSAYDLGVITRYAIKKYPQILKYMGQKEDINIPKTDKHGAHWLYHISDMLKIYPGMDGAKTGYTWEAGHTFIGTALRDKRLVVVVLNSQNPNSDITNLLDYGFMVVGKVKNP